MYSYCIQCRLPELATTMMHQDSGEETDDLLDNLLVVMSDIDTERYGQYTHTGSLAYVFYSNSRQSKDASWI